MRTWARSQGGSCGYCGVRLERGTAVQLIAIPLVTRKLRRCELCVGPAPLDLAPLLDPIEPITLTRFTAPSSPREWIPYRDDA